MSPNTMYLRISSNRIFYAVCFVALLYFVIMDYRLYRRLREYAVRPWSGNTVEKEYPPTPSCDIDPICSVTVKGMMLDYPNYYLLGPLAAIFDNFLHTNTWSWITPDAISISHVFVAIVAGKFVSMKSLGKRRFGVVLFQLRSWLDDLDGLVARKRNNVSGEHSEIGATGYIVDGICDTLGTTALLIGIFQYLRTYLSKHGYERLQTILPIDGKILGSCVIHRKKLRARSIARTIILIAGSLVASSITWNRYLYIYQDLLETDYPRGSVPSLRDLRARQSDVFRLNSFWLISVLWRLTNPHALLDYLLIAIFIDRLWDYVDKAQWIIYGAVIGLAYITEFYYHQALLYVAGASIVYPNDDPFNEDILGNFTSRS